MTETQVRILLYRDFILKWKEVAKCRVPKFKHDYVISLVGSMAKIYLRKMSKYARAEVIEFAQRTATRHVRARETAEKDKVLAHQG